MKDETTVRAFLIKPSYESEVSVFFIKKLAGISNYMEIRGIEYFDSLGVNENGEPNKIDKGKTKKKRILTGIDHFG